MLFRSTTTRTLVTFDVDGTLVHGSGRAAAESVHARAFSHAVSTVFHQGRPVTPVADALPRRLYHGSTDGLILLRLVEATTPGVTAAQAFDKLDQLMDCMYDYVMAVDNDAITEHIQPLPGVLDHLRTLAQAEQYKNSVHCGLVTGNVEGIARRKMHAVGIFDTTALSPPCWSQLKKYKETEHISFLGGFGSDYCSGNVQDLDRNYLDRAEQIAICTNRCRQSLLKSNNAADSKPPRLARVVHVGDAPADVLAAKAFCQQQQQLQQQSNDDDDDKLTVGMVAVATGSYSADELQALCGDPVPGVWEPIVLPTGMASPDFLQACGL